MRIGGEELHLKSLSDLINYHSHHGSQLSC